MTEPTTETDPTLSPTAPTTATTEGGTTSTAHAEENAEITPLPDSLTVPIAALACPQCLSPYAAPATFCADCGFIFPLPSAGERAPMLPDRFIAERYKLVALVSERGDVIRYRGLDIGLDPVGVPVTVLREPRVDIVPIAPTVEMAIEDRLDFNLSEDADQRTDELVLPAVITPSWPSIAWEQRVFQVGSHLSLPRLIDVIEEEGFRYLIVEIPTGQVLWDAWEKPTTTWRQRCTWLIQLAEALQGLHRAGAILEELRPEMVTVSPTGQAIITDMSRLLPLPLPEDVPLRGSHYSAPELLLRPALTDERADIYVFGALVYALLMGRELTDLDFSLAGKPRSYLERFPEAHPFLARLLAKTFVREIHHRFPSDDSPGSDPTGFTELIACLQGCRRTLDRVHLDIAAWSNTGIIRSGNEDAVAIVHSSEGRLDDTDEFAMILLADGMGGMESGEIAAALALQVIRQRLLNTPPYLAFQTRSPAIPVEKGPDVTPTIESKKTLFLPAAKFTAEGLMIRPEDRDTAARSPEAYRERIVDALKEANRQVHDAARYGFGGRGMGCTVEVVLIDGAEVFIGHVGDSRVYHMHAGKLTLVTRDQTFVQRMVDLGQMSQDEADNHPRRSELEQAVGGRADIFPDFFHLTLVPGDWLIVCSDGISNQLHNNVLEQVLFSSPSAEKASRRLINLALEAGAFDNVTVAVVRAE